MKNRNDLKRFEDAQNDVYPSALTEIRMGKKRGHWMWFIFPQIKGLGASEMAQFYAIKSKAEATEYLRHPVLGQRLIEISKQLLKLPTDNAQEIFGSIDSMKLKSSMTLFSLLDNATPVFQQVLDKFFDGKPDEKTITIINDAVV